jgi:hypothetical protein
MKEETHMTELPPHPDANRDISNDTALRPDRRSVPSTPPSTPRWVKVFGIIFILLILLIIIMHLAGFGFGGHGAGHTPAASVILYGIQER